MHTSTKDLEDNLAKEIQKDLLIIHPPGATNSRDLLEESLERALNNTTPDSPGSSRDEKDAYPPDPDWF